MRSLLPFLVLVLATPACAQLSGNPNTLNETNDRLATQNQIRGNRQQQQFESNQTQMQIQRNEQFRPAPTPTIAPPRR